LVNLSMLSLVVVLTEPYSQAQEPSHQVQENYKAVTFTLMRLPGDNERLEARITILSLDREDSVTVRTSQGQLAGSVVPFGPRRADKAVTFAVPIPKDAVLDGKVTLHLSIKSHDGKSMRAPRDS